MVLSPTMLYLHLPKAGGTYVANRLEAYGLGEHVSAQQRRPHVPARELPSEWFTGRFVWATIRNPLDWYVSWTSYFTREDGAHHGQLADRVGEAPRPFREILRALLWPEGNIDRPIRTYRRASLAPVLREQAERRQGFLSWLLEESCGHSVQAWVDLADIDAGMSRLLGVTFEPGEPLNVNGRKSGHGRAHSPHGPVESYYDDESIAWVRRMDAPLFGRFGYTGPGSSATRGVA